MRLGGCRVTAGSFQLVGRWSSIFFHSRPSGSYFEQWRKWHAWKPVWKLFPASTPDANAALRIKDMHRRSSPAVPVTGLFINIFPAPHRLRHSAPEDMSEHVVRPFLHRDYPANPSYLRIRSPPYYRNLLGV